MNFTIHDDEVTPDDLALRRIGAQGVAQQGEPWINFYRPAELVERVRALAVLVGRVGGARGLSLSLLRQPRRRPDVVVAHRHSCRARVIGAVTRCTSTNRPTTRHIAPRSVPSSSLTRRRAAAKVIGRTARSITPPAPNGSISIVAASGNRRASITDGPASRGRCRSGAGAARLGTRSSSTKRWLASTSPPASWRRRSAWSVHCSSRTAPTNSGPDICAGCSAVTMPGVSSSASRARQRSRQPQRACRSRRRRLRRQRPEGVELERASVRLGHPDRSDELRRTEAPRYHVLHRRHAHARHRAPAAAPDHRPHPFHRSVLDRCAHPGGERGRVGRRRLGPDAHGAVERSDDDRHDHHIR